MSDKKVEVLVLIMKKGGRINWSRALVESHDAAPSDEPIPPFAVSVPRKSGS